MNDTQGKYSPSMLNIRTRVTFGSLLPSVAAPLLFIPWIVIYAYLTGERRPLQEVTEDFLLPLILLGPVLFVPCCVASFAITVLPSLRPGRSRFLLVMQGLFLSLFSLHIAAHLLFSQDLKEQKRASHSQKNTNSYHVNQDMLEYSISLSISKSGFGEAANLTAERGYHRMALTNLLDGAGLPPHAVFLSTVPAILAHGSGHDGLSPDLLLCANGTNDGFAAYDFRDTDLAWWHTSLPTHWDYGFTNIIPIPTIHGGDYFHFYCRINDHYGKGRIIRHSEKNAETIHVLGTVLISKNAIP